MKLDLLSYAFGFVLLFVAIIGGGFEVRELKVPRVGRAVRMVSGGTGVLFLLLGIGFSAGTADPEPASPTPPAAVSGEATPTPINFVVRDELAEDQLAEQVTVRVDGRMIGTLTVDVVHPSSSLTVTVPKAGEYDYSLDATFSFVDEEDEISLRGTGTINVRDGSEFSLGYADDGSDVVPYLAELS